MSTHQHIKILIAGCLISIAVNSCCSIPLVDCGPKMIEIGTTPTTINFDSGFIKKITIKGWLLKNRKLVTDSLTIDFELSILYDSISKSQYSTLEYIFEKDNFLLLGQEKYVLDTSRLLIDYEILPPNDSLKTVQFYFSFVVDREDIIGSNNQKQLVINNINPLDKNRMIVVQLKVTRK